MRCQNFQNFGIFLVVEGFFDPISSKLVGLISCVLLFSQG